MTKRRIAMISYHTSPEFALSGNETGGMNVYVFELSKQLGAQGYEIDIYTRCYGCRGSQVTLLSENVRLIRIHAGPQQKLSKKKLAHYIPEFALKMDEYIYHNNLNYDLIHAHYYMSGLVALNLKKTKAPLIVNFHTLALMKNLVARSADESESNKRISAEMEIASKAAKIVAVSDQDMDYITYFYSADREKIVVVPPGVDLTVFKKRDKRGARTALHLSLQDNIILFVGRIEPLKGIDALLYALKIIIERNKLLSQHITLILIGGDTSQKKTLWSKEMKKLHDLQKTLGISANVQFIGYKSRNILSQYYNASDVLVMPSHYESFGIVALEAVASGLPIISTAVSGFVSSFENAGVTVTPVNSPIHLADTIEKIIKTKNSLPRKTITESQIKNFSWEAIAHKILQVYKSVW